MNTTHESQELWKKLENSVQDVIGTSLPTRGLGGRSSGKRFAPAELRDDKLFLAIEGRESPPKNQPFLRVRDLEFYLKYEKKEIGSVEAKRSFRTSYAGPLVDLLRNLPS